MESIPQRITATHLIVERSGLTQSIMYLYYTGESFIGSDYLMRLFLIRDALLYNRRNRCLIKVVSVVDDTNRTSIVNLQEHFLRQCLPLLKNHFFYSS